MRGNKKQSKVNQQARNRAVEACNDAAIREPPPKTWVARAERRRREKERSARGVKKMIVEDIVQQVENQRVEAMMMCFALALHEEYGFGKERCLRALTRVDSYMEPWVSSRESLEQLRQKVKDEVGLVITC